MNPSGPTAYGDPCRECGFGWGITLADAVEVLRASVGDLLELVDTGEVGGSERVGTESWTSAGYVAHVGDNLRIWAERMAGRAAGARPEVAAYDQDRLAEARRYDAIPIQAARWTLQRALAEWLEAMELCSALEPTGEAELLVHAGFGPMSLGDVARENAHDAAHHLRDMRLAAGIGRG